MASMSPARRVAPLLVTLLAISVAGCGGGTRATTITQRAAPPSTSGGIDPEALPPRSIPRQPTGAPDPEAVRTIEAWARAVRRGDLTAAARLFALPARFQNGTSVLTLRRRLDVLAVTSGFSCGAIPTRFGGAGPYTLVRFRLTSRAGGDCRDAEGHTTGGAIRVVHGRIRAWYRLYDRDEIAPRAPQADPDDPQV